MFDLDSVLYVIILAILGSFLFSFWLIVVWVGLIHCYIYITEWKKARAQEKHVHKDFFENIEELKNDFK